MHLHWLVPMSESPWVRPLHRQRWKQQMLRFYPMILRDCPGSSPMLGACGYHLSGHHRRLGREDRLLGIDPHWTCVAVGRDRCRYRHRRPGDMQRLAIDSARIQPPAVITWMDKGVSSTGRSRPDGRVGATGSGDVTAPVDCPEPTAAVEHPPSLAEEPHGRLAMEKVEQQDNVGRPGGYPDVRAPHDGSTGAAAGH